MTSLAERARRVGSTIDASWDEDDLERNLAGLHRRLRRRRRSRRLGAATVALVVAGLVIYLGTPGARTGSHAIAPADRDVAPRMVTPRAIATPLSADTVVYTSDDRRDAVAMRLERGAARFEVRHDPSQAFRVDAGPVLVEVIGTEFTIARDAHQATVTVHRGEVRAHWHEGAAVLRAGEAATFPPAVVQEPPARPRPTARSAPPAAVEPPPEETVDQLLEAADRARLDGRTDDAVSLLERALARPLDPEREAVAAFALGNVRSRRGEPALAARTFARAHAADPDGALAEDAIAREVEAWAHAHDAERARDAARRYQQRYPDGRRSKMVRECIDGL